MSRLAAKNRVVYINPGCTVVRALIMLFTTKFLVRHRIVQDHGVYVFIPPTYLIRFPMFQRADHWLKKYRNRLMYKELKKLGLAGSENMILWLSRPDEAEAIDYFKPKMVCYHIVDEYSAYMEMPYERVRLLEEETARKADVVITVSRSLYEKKRVLNKNIHIVPNGVDEGFLKGRDKGRGEKGFSDESGDRPSDMKGIGRPVIGYVGAINPKVDLELIAFMAEKKQEWQILMIGPIHLRTLWDNFHRQLRRLRRLRNVHFLGEKPVDEVERYFRAIDVGILPYKLNVQGLNLSPIKMFEYLACGKPCVSVDVPSVREYGDVVRVAKGYEEFVDMVERAFKENSPELDARRIGVAMESTWDRRVEQISDLLAEALKRKGLV